MALGTIASDTIQDGAGNSTATTNAIKGSAKAWVQFTGATPTILSSYGVSSISKVSTGYWTFVLTNPSSVSSFATVASGAGSTTATAFSIVCYPLSTSSVLVQTYGGTGGTSQDANMQVIVIY